MLSKRDQLLVDIACEWQKRLSSPYPFFQIKDLFVEGEGWANDSNATAWVGVQCYNYFEDEQGNPLSESEYMEAVLRLPPMTRLHNGLHGPKNLPEEIAKSSGFAEIIPVRASDISLHTDEIQIINQYVKDAYELKECPLLTPNSFIYSEIASGKYQCKKNITRGEFDSSLMVLRRLYMQDDFASFSKTMGILQDRRKINHPLVNIFSKKRKQYNKLLKSPADELPIVKHFLCGTSIDFPTCEDILRIYWYIDRIHQGDPSTQALNAQVRSKIPDDDALDFILYSIFIELSQILVDTANYARKILHAIGEVKVKIQLRHISNIERDFLTYLKDMSYKFAEVIWREKGMPPCGITVFQPEAAREIKKRFSISDEIEI